MEFEMAKGDKPNILILWGDDIGWWNISYNNRGQMGLSDAQYRPYRSRRRDVH
jgi:arylsulfatase A-like enzyme